MHEPQYAISVRQPWAELILRGDKTTEERSWQLPWQHVNRWLCLHAARTFTATEKDLALNTLGTTDLPRGANVGLIKFGWPQKTDRPRHLNVEWCWSWPIIAAVRGAVVPARGRLGIYDSGWDLFCPQYPH